MFGKLSVLTLSRLGEVKRAQTLLVNTHQLCEVLTDMLCCLVYKILLSMFCCQDEKSLLSHVVTWKQCQRFKQTKRVRLQDMESETKAEHLCLLKGRRESPARSVGP